MLDSIQFPIDFPPSMYSVLRVGYQWTSLRLKDTFTLISFLCSLHLYICTERKKFFMNRRINVHFFNSQLGKEHSLKGLVCEHSLHVESKILLNSIHDVSTWNPVASINNLQILKVTFDVLLTFNKQTSNIRRGHYA